MKFRTAFIVVASLIACSATGCNKEAPAETRSDPAAAAAPASPEAQARKTFRTVCTACHGADGKGDGPGAAALNPKPRDYTNVAWQDGVTDEQLKQTILMGGAAVGKSASMPAQPQLQSKPEVVAELVKIIRGFKGK
jgi:mono/diheme cytochrome c family protein